MIIMRASKRYLQYIACLDAVLSLSGCSIVPRQELGSPVSSLTTYHVKPGCEESLRCVLDQTWKEYRKMRMVQNSPHLVFITTEDEKHNMLVAIFDWVSGVAAEHPSKKILELWDQAESYCEPRGGALGIEPKNIKILNDKSTKIAPQRSK